MEFAIQTHQLTRNFGDFCAVNQVNIQVRPGTFYGFLGPNGAGKSTTIKMLTGLLAPTSGRARVLGKDIFQMDEALEAKQHIGVIPEDLALFNYLNAREHLTFIGRMYLIPAEVVETRIGELLNLLKLEEAGSKLILEYSHGMKKKLALAAALLPDPDLLFLDEPFEGVDAVSSRVIRDILLDYVRRGSTVFLTSHVLDVVEKLCTHVGIIADGRLVVQASLDDIRQGSSLEEKFLSTVGADDEAVVKLSWLE